MKRSSILGLAVVALFTAAAAPADAPDLRSLFPHEAPVSVDGAPELARVLLPPEILEKSAPDLADVRLFDRDGKEVPFAVDAGRRERERLVASERIEAKLLDVDREVTRPEDGPARWSEGYELRLPDDKPIDGAWDLVFESRERSFVRRVDVAVIDDGGSRRAVELGVNGIFRLPEMNQTRTRVTLPPLDKGARLEVRIRGEGDGYFEPRIFLESSRGIGGSARAEVHLAEVSRVREDGATILELTRPRGLVPDLLRIETASGQFDREVEVRDLGAASLDARLGASRLFRMRGLITAENIEVELAPPRGDRLRVRIADGDSPALEEVKVTAIVRTPALIFPASRGPFTLAFGGGRADRPVYDLGGLAAAPGEVLTGVDARAMLALYVPGELPLARLGALRPNPMFRSEPLLGFAMRAGAVVDARGYARRRGLAVRPSAEGLARLVLTPDDLAAARLDLADLRVVDSTGKQWPFLVVREATSVWSELPAPREDGKAGESHYPLTLPATPGRIAELSVDAAAPFFDRGFRVEGIQTVEGQSRRDAKSHVLQRGRLVRRAGDPRPVSIALPATRFDALVLVVEDGDDAPLDASVRARLPLAELMLVAPAGSYTLLAGNPEDRGPRYELAQVRDIVLAVDAGSIDAGGLEANPAFSRSARLIKGGGALQTALWTSIVLAVVVLGALTVRLARREQEEDQKA